MYGNISRRASDGRRGKWRAQDERDRAWLRMGLWVTDGSAALALNTGTTYPPKSKLVPSLCDGLVSVIRREWRFGWWYIVRVGRTIREMKETELLQFWAHFYKAFRATATPEKPFAVTLNWLPAPQQPYGLLPSGLTA